uniref:Uncharacterized protein n=1 Tax=Romanomermis culicivorax TaxID=13658 RepID=A0A915IU45_ROMCU
MEDCKNLIAMVQTLPARPEPRLTCSPMLPSPACCAVLPSVPSVLEPGLAHIQALARAQP